MKFIKLILVILLLPFFWAINYNGIINISKYFISLQYKYFYIGFISYIFLYLILFKNFFNFIETFEHELTHMVVSFLFFKRVFSFQATDKRGGNVTHTSGNFLISLAPYFLPLFTIFFLILKPFMISATYNVLDFLIGFTLAFHYVGLIKEFRFYQQDIKMQGKIFSTIIIITFNILFLLLVFYSLNNNLEKILDFLKTVFYYSINYYKSLYYEIKKDLNKIVKEWR